jgi:hypothetical protein
LCLVFQDTGNCFPRAGFEPWSSWSLPPEWVGLQVWATSTRLNSLNLRACSYFLAS